MYVIFVFRVGNYFSKYFDNISTTFRQHGRFHIVATTFHGNIAKTFHHDVELQKKNGEGKEIKKKTERFVGLHLLILYGLFFLPVVAGDGNSKKISILSSVFEPAIQDYHIHALATLLPNNKLIRISGNYNIITKIFCTM